MREHDAVPGSSNAYRRLMAIIDAGGENTKGEEDGAHPNPPQKRGRENGPLDLL